MNATLVEKRTVEGAYGINSDQLIVDTEAGRLLVCDGYGGNDLQGFTHRWQHGTVNKLQPGDTFADLDGYINPVTTLMQCVISGNDPDRPLQMWTGSAIDNFARSII